MYPLKFEPQLKSILWGGNKITTFKGADSSQDGIGESWEISAVPGSISVIANGDYKGKTLAELIEQQTKDLLGAKVIENFGLQFPLLIKFIDAKDHLSIQVHPNDELAKQRHNSAGKTEIWYVIDAEPGAGLYSGFSKKITPQEYVERVKNDTIMEVLQFHQVKKGDVFFIPAGRVHAIGKGVFIAEIQQTSNITYRIYDYNRKDAAGNSRELHTELAKDAIDYTLYNDYLTHYAPQLNGAVRLITCDYFTVYLLTLTQTITRPVASHSSFIVYMCMEGSATITIQDGGSEEICQGQTILIPANASAVTIVPHGSVVLLESYA